MSKAARAVGRVLRGNLYIPYVPCHRGIFLDGSISGYSAKGGIKAKIRMLEKEGVRISSVWLLDNKCW